MQWLTPEQSDSTIAQPVQRIGFDIIRAMVAARAAANPTVAALRQAEAGHGGRSNNHAGGCATMALLNGRHRPADDHADAGAGAFFALRHGSAWHGEMVSSNGESHA
jgi:hypothetical protein